MDTSELTFFGYKIYLADTNIAAIQWPLEETIRWAIMRIKPHTSRSLSMWKGTRKNLVSFTLNGEKIPLLAQPPVHILGKLYTADLSDKHIPVTILKQLSEGLEMVDKCHLPGKPKVWCYQFTMYLRLMWPARSQHPQYWEWITRPTIPSATG